MDVIEKRKSVRVEADFPASFSHETGDHTGRIFHLSVEGALLKADALINPGEIIELTFQLPEHEARVKARIIWSKPIESTFGMGVFFEDIPADHKAAIELYIRNVLKI